MTDKFNIFIEKTLEFEGGFSNASGDSGGRTIYGISENNWSEDFNKVYSLYNSGNTDSAIETAKQFYFDNFYDLQYENIIDSKLAFRLFDFGINAGKSTAVKQLQETLGIDVDGNFGNETLTATNNFNDISTAYQNRLNQFYLNLVANNSNDQKFLNGWENRIKEYPDLSNSFFLHRPTVQMKQRDCKTI